MKEGLQDRLAQTTGSVAAVLTALTAALGTYLKMVKGTTPVGGTILAGVFLGFFSTLFVYEIVCLISRPIVRKRYQPKITVGPERVRERSSSGWR
jgi:hypothetical protein